MKLPPASANRSTMWAASSLLAPQPPRRSPKIIAPKHSSETRRPVRPSSL
jgi:hypothetical protein